MIQENLPDSADKIQKSQSANPPTSLNEQGVCKALELKIKDDLEEFTKEFYYEGFRWHLGASLIGNECKRLLWYNFRWVATEKPSGRLQRLFNRGHLEETRWPQWLTGMGFKVYTHDTEAPLKEDGTMPQYRIKNRVGGHFGGSLDGILEFPASYNIKEPALFSCKTSGTGAGFNKMSKEPLVLAKRDHYIQECIYGNAYGIEHVVYAVTNKNDDDVVIKVEKLDFELAKNMEVKAHSIIFSQTPPPRISENATFMQCKNFCQFKDICHYNKPVAVNCRSCINCHAIDNGEFFCQKWEAQIPREAIPAACPEWVSIAIDSAGNKEQSTYETAAGKPDFEIEFVPLPK
jgi:hypothetical protein